VKGRRTMLVVTMEAGIKWTGTRMMIAFSTYQIMLEVALLLSLLISLDFIRIRRLSS
jgi:hypothetical protein